MKFSRHWLWLLLLVPIAIGAARLRFDVDVLNLLPGELPVVQGLKIYQQNFSTSRELIITVESSDSEQAEAAAKKIADTLRHATNLVSSAIWQPPWLERPADSAELIGYLWLNQPPYIFSELTNRFQGENLTNTLREAREQLAASFSPNDIALRQYDPFGLLSLPESATGNIPSFGQGQEIFASADGTFRIIFVEPKESLSNYRNAIAWLKKIKALVQSEKLSDGPEKIKVHYTGGPAFTAEIAGGMESDMAGPSVGTLGIIAILFYFTHRRWLPLIWLIILLILILGGTLALGGLFFGRLNVVSLGFASILLGLAEDFGIVLYQESQSHPELSLAEIRRAAAPGIFWSAVTTSGAFVLLNLSGLPGLGQLGWLVAIGIALAAVVMLFAYLPPLLRHRTEKAGNEVPQHGLHFSQSQPRIKATWTITILLVAFAGFLLWRDPPQFDQSPNSLRPKKSEAYDAMAEMKVKFSGKKEPLWLLIEGRNEEEIGRTLEASEQILNRAVSNQTITSFNLPTPLWPKAEFQQKNKSTALTMAAEEARLTRAALSFGFTSNSLAMTRNIFQTWQVAAAATNTFWPTNENSRWILDEFSARDKNRIFAAGLIYAPTNTSFAQLSTLNSQLPSNVHLSGWDLLGPAISKLVFSELPKVLIPILLVILISLWLAFRSLREVLLSLATLFMSGVCLVILMHFAGWTWNMMNLMAVPLLLGMGVDFSIHMQLALRRYGGNWTDVRDSIGRALLLAGSTTVAGFASLGFSSNAGLASLGKVCAAGITCAMLVAVYLLPVWWSAVRRKR